MSGRRILITGVAGFVGGYLSRRIADRGDIPLGLGMHPAAPVTRAFLADERIVDLRDPEALAAAIAAMAPDAVVHLAGQSSVGRSIQDPIETYNSNAAGTWNLLEAVRRATPGARVLCVGSADIYGPQPEGSRVREDAPARPVSPYGLSKVVADEAAAFYAGHLGLDVVRTRSFAHIGAGQTDRFVVPSLARQIVAIENGKGEPVLRTGNLNVVRDLTDVRSVVDAYVALLGRGRSGGVYNVCSGNGVLLSDLAGRLIERARVPVTIEVDAGRMRPADVPYLVGDPTDIATDTGWRAEVDLDRALDEILAEWRSREPTP